MTGLTKHCMSRVTPFDDASLHRQCAVTLGAISARLLESAVSAASGMDILTELHAHLHKLLLPGNIICDQDTNTYTTDLYSSPPPHETKNFELRDKKCAYTM